MPFVNRIYVQQVPGNPVPRITLGEQGPIFNVVVGVHDQYVQHLTQQGQVVPAPIQVLALLDTGATATCIDKQTAMDLGLMPTGSITLLTPEGQAAQPRPTYAITFEIQGTTFRRSLTNAIETDLKPQGFEMLIGRDILAECHMVFNGPLGLVTLSHP